MKCSARIKLSDTLGIIDCELDDHLSATHSGIIRDAAYPGSETILTWLETDRRNFRGDWIECPFEGCILPAGHPRGHA